MDRRKFLTLATAASIAPTIPLPAARAGAAAAGYNRYTYGLAVFHARTRASVSVIDLTARLKLSTPQAKALIGEMTAKGVVTPALNAAPGVVRAVHRVPRPAVSPTARPANALRKVADWLDKDTGETTSKTTGSIKDDIKIGETGPNTDAIPTFHRRDTAGLTDADPAPLFSGAENGQ